MVKEETKAASKETKNKKLVPVDGALEAAWVDHPARALPEALDDGGEGLDEAALHAGVAGVDLAQVVVGQQVAGQLLGVAQALEDQG